jgi:hypothetical protein
MPTLSNTVRRTQTPDGGILLDIEQGQIFALNVIGSKILDLVEAGHDEAQIAEQLSTTCGMDINTVRVDVRDFLEALSKHSILQRSKRATGGERERNHGG